MQIAWQCKYILGEWANRPDDECSRVLRWRARKTALTFVVFGHLSFNDSEPIRRSEDAQIFRSSDLKCWQPSISICQRHRQRQMHMQMRIQMQEQQHRCICLPKRIRRASNPLNVRKQHSSVGCHNGCDDPRTGGVNIQELIQIFGVVSHRRFP